jgi:uncharacterized membrane protein
MFDFTLSQFVSPVSLFFDIVGIFLVVLGGVVAIISWIHWQVVHVQNREKLKHQIQDLRVHFAQKLVLGLEFFLAGDIIRLITTPTADVLIRVGSIIIIRSVLAYFLSREIKELRGK